VAALADRRQSLQNLPVRVDRYPKGTVLLVLPAYNEEAALPSTVEGCCQVVESEDILVVDDGSTDATAEVARRLGVRCARLPVNLGIGGAVQTGYRYALRADYRVAVQVDADGQHDPHDVPALVEPVRGGRCDMAIGSRYLTAEGFTSTLPRRLGSRLLSAAIRASTGARIADCTSGFRAVNRRVLASFARYYPTDYPEPESLAILLHSGLKVLELPVVMRPRQGGVSSIKALDGAIYMVKVLSVISAYGTFHGTVARET
jgi:glycosyltransferase involved in cell wall biosynthesis